MYPQRPVVLLSGIRSIYYRKSLIGIELYGSEFYGSDKLLYLLYLVYVFNVVVLVFSIHKILSIVVPYHSGPIFILIVKYHYSTSPTIYLWIPSFTVKSTEMTFVLILSHKIYFDYCTWLVLFIRDGHLRLSFRYFITYTLSKHRKFYTSWCNQ